MSVWRMKHIAGEGISAAISQARSEVCASHNAPITIDLRWEKEASGTWTLTAESHELTLVEILGAMKAHAL